MRAGDTHPGIRVDGLTVHVDLERLRPGPADKPLLWLMERDGWYPGRAVYDEPVWWTAWPRPGGRAVHHRATPPHVLDGR